MWVDIKGRFRLKLITKQFKVTSRFTGCQTRHSRDPMAALTICQNASKNRVPEVVHGPSTSLTIRITGLE